jgi:4-diphosphocytidyl-2-C-methyl-D-erythritol kinase
MEIIGRPVREWRGLLRNDFELSVTPKIPQVGILISQMYEHGALYAAMSGSGSAVFGVFENKPSSGLFEGTWFLQEPSSFAL